MNITIKSKQEIEKMRIAGQICASILQEAKQIVVSGISTMDIEEFITKRLQHYKVTSPFLGLDGYPYNSCESVNECIIHGLPSTTNILKDGDVLKMDMGVTYQDMIVDHAICLVVGDADRFPSSKKIVEVSQKINSQVISICRDGRKIRDLSDLMDFLITENGYHPMMQYSSHGVGYALHEDPDILNFSPIYYPRVEMKSGMTFAIEPMFSEKECDVEIGNDKWSVIIKKGGLSAVTEHTVLILDEGVEILTLP